MTNIEQDKEPVRGLDTWLEEGEGTKVLALGGGRGTEEAVELNLCEGILSCS